MYEDWQDEPTEIVVVKRSDDFMAHPKGDSSRWGCGKTISDAIGNMILAHAEHFNLKVKVEKA